MVNTTNNSRPDPEEIKELLREDGPSSLSRDGSRKEDRRNLDFLYDIPLNISVEVGRSKIKLKDLLKMGEGYVLELDKLAGEPLDLYVNSKLIAKGEAVMVGDKFGIRLTDVVSTADRIENLG
ncbi:flagellar motor switch protein FliN [Desulforhopalus sp. IMCC35007]|uniref:flagellar motor switch protein FliN n=1 Tax=Desulforhopalus sp. IMCC35007 TaxID=2569543 RepID=UPI0010ADFAC5|nr:flagellar motor switch protein FliN [Desulforhopalus sp. IMCC35007]TKB10283.1 flagellar motor switch protein FliN [Desulforhopalus sp. IMCC35007]